MTTSILSAALLQQSDPAAFTQRLYQRDNTDSPTDAATEAGTQLANTKRTTVTTSQQNLFADLNADRARQFGATYSASGSPGRSTTNTVFVGYG